MPKLKPEPTTLPTVAVTLVSFGFKYGTPTGGPVLDLRTWLRNPWKVKELRPLTGLDPRVQLYLVQDPHFQQAVQEVFRAIEKGPEVIYIGCQGGKHRSVALADRVGHLLMEAFGLTVTVEHRDLDRKDG